MLSKVSNTSIDEIYLYSAELFERQVKFFDLKIEAEYQEQEEERKIQQALAMALAKAKNKSNG